MNPNQKVTSRTSTFFVIFGKIWRVPNTRDESRTRLDELEISATWNVSCLSGRRSYSNCKVNNSNQKNTVAE